MSLISRAVLWAAAAGIATPSAALELTAKNLAFESWDAQGRLVAWSVQPAGPYAVGRDCEAIREDRCVLRIAAAGDVVAGAFQPVGQSIGPGAAAGHGLTLSGWIRTSGVASGWAGLWMRVDVEGKPIVLENMLQEGPRGTTGWRRFEVKVPVAANATLVAFGVLLHGAGTAWFDELKLTVDASLAVGEAPKTRVVDPPRPRRAPGLAGDIALALASSDIPRIRDEWREEVRRDARPIRSLFSDDFSDLQFLKPLLEGKRLVQLGESAHGIAEFSWLKVRLAKFLHQEMGYDVIAFESSLTACDIANARVGVSTPVDVMRDCIFATWHSSETLGLFEYLDAVRGAGRTLDLAGFDVQDSGRARRDTSARLLKHVERVDSELARTLRVFEEKLVPPLAPGDVPAMKATYEAAAQRLAGSRDALAKLEAQRPAEVDVVIQEAKARARYVEQLANDRQAESSRVRDEGMADNLDFLLDRLYPGRRIIVWAHNFHIEKRARTAAEPRPMGAWISRRRGPEAYALGLYMGRGVATWNNRARYEIVAPAPDSLEAVLANAGWRMSFVDFSRASPVPGSWMQAPLVARDWGVKALRITPALSYDGVIYIDTITPPEYL